MARQVITTARLGGLNVAEYKIGLTIFFLLKFVAIKQQELTFGNERLKLNSIVKIITDQTYQNKPSVALDNKCVNK
jgi:hypothetical protein